MKSARELRHESSFKWLATRTRLGPGLMVVMGLSCAPEESPSPEPTPTPASATLEPTPPPAAASRTPLPDQPTPAAPSNQLDPLSWYAPNVTSLNTFFAAQAAQDPRSGALLVIGWDDSLLFGSLTEATFRYQLQNLAFKVTPEVLEAILPSSAGSTWDAPGSVTEVEGVSLQALRDDILSAYRVLYAQYAPTGGCSSACQSLETLKSTLEFKSLFSKFLFLVQGLSQHPEVGEEYTSVLLTRLYAGMTETEARQQVVAAWTYERGLAIQSLAYTSPDSGQSGMVSGSYQVGLRAYPELADLLVVARKAGFDGWVVAAAPQWVIQAVIGAQIGYDVDESNVIGIQLEKIRTDTAQVYGSEPSSESAIPYGAGKLQAIEAGIGKPPVLIVGGKDEDRVLIEQAGSDALTLVINRMEGCPFSDLYLEADASGGAELGTRLLQGIDNEAGAFWPEQTVLPFGGGSAEPLPPACE